MPLTIGLTAKEGSAVEFYCNPDSETYNNWVQSYKKANYSQSKGWKQNAGKVLIKPRVKQAVVEYRAKTGQIWEHNRQISVDALNLNIIRMQAKADDGDIQACTAITAAIRELNAISSLHSSKVVTETKAPVIPEEDRAALKELATRYKLRIAREA